MEPVLAEPADRATTGKDAGADPLADPDPRTVAEHAHLENLLRCWLTESGRPVTAGPLQLRLHHVGATLRTEVRYRSPTGGHRFGPVRLASAPDLELPAAVAAALVATEAAAGGGVRAGGIPAGEVSDLVARTHDSVTRVARFVAARRAAPDSPTGIDGFLDAEQALLLGHLRHPAPKSRDGIADADLDAWAPELRAATALHWFAVDPELVRHDAVTDSPAMGGEDTPALLDRLAGFDRDDRGGGQRARRLRGRIVVPAHPWQAADLPRRRAVADLIDAGAVHPLGPHGPPWWPTSSWRTLYHPGRTVMLKLSLGLRLTNCRRESSRRELRRGPAVHRLLDAGLGTATRAEHPGFQIVRDPAWLAVLGSDGALTGLDVSVREVPPGIGALRCLAGLLAPRPGIGPCALAALPAVRRDPAGWLADYAGRVLVPMLHFYSATGIGLEGHQQNTLVRLGRDGSVVGGAFRDNQGFYLARDALGPVRAVLGEESVALDALDPDELDGWLCYYLLHNQTLSVVGALGEAGLVDERALLRTLTGVLRAALPALADAGPHGARLVRRWLRAATLPAKANLFTRLHGVDEVTAPMSAQAVFLEVPNPLLE